MKSLCTKTKIMNKYFAILLPLVILTSSCKQVTEEVAQETSSTGTEEASTRWRGAITLNDSVDLPFNFEWDGKDQFTIFNGEEKIVSTSVTEVNDSLRFEFPVFANYFLLKESEGKLNGNYINPDSKNYKLPLTAQQGDSARFKNEEKNCCDINKKWAVKFSPNTEDEYPAIGFFKQEGSYVSGTFVTETGDYRFLEGSISGNKLSLSTFDGAHAFVFTADINNGETMNGRFYSGPRWSEPWMAYRDDSFELRNADNLTYLKESYTELDFSFPDAEGNLISLKDDRFKDKAVIVQIMGTWCPNCMDESRYMKQVYNKYNSEGLEIISLAFERMMDKEKAFKRIAKLKADLDLPYPILLAGVSNKIEAAKSLPMLNHIMSFPTAIYLNRNHEIEKIHTGFSGPGTPLYDKYVAENKLLLDKMIAEGNTNENL